MKRKRGWNEASEEIDSIDYTIGMNECNNTVIDDDTGRAVLCRTPSRRSPRQCCFHSPFHAPAGYALDP
eukprot:6148470-Pleurochrysis_carterae.AAC.2